MQDPDFEPDPGVWPTWTFQQYDWTGSVPGVQGGAPPVDLDSFNGDLAALQALANYTSDGDWDDDGDVDLADLAEFALCFSGSSDQSGYVAPTDDCRRVFDINGDGDVDNHDFVALHAGMTGP